jgi:hypothetical protein
MMTMITMVTLLEPVTGGSVLISELLHTTVARAPSVISNVLSRRDTEGNILESGDGSLINFNGVYYLYGTRYQPCPVADQKCCYEWCGAVWLCGWRNMTVSVYSSPNLVDWKLETTSALPQARTHPTINTQKYAFFEPAVIYNAKTRKYVMWFVIQMHGGDGGQGVATSDSPTGPFTYVRSEPTITIVWCVCV